ncbi:Fic family protein [Veillonella sp. 3960]|uniref:Fic family protein n=1 Tax=Veillonella sp. 3960 TaxID=2490955 RepID=UPI000F8D36F0|nr:Fic family protein [Veillonella sp. 3960]
MKYESLYKLYRKSEADWKKRYEERFQHEFTVHLPIAIKEYNRKVSFPAFYCYAPEMMSLVLRIYKETAEFIKELQPMPNVLLNHLMNSFLVDEIKSSNDIEGVRSSRREIKESLEQFDSNRPLRFHSIIEKYKQVLHVTDEGVSIRTCEELRTFYESFLWSEIEEKDRPDGRLFRADSVDVKTGTDKIIHQGLFPESTIIDTMTEALRILNDDTIEVPIRVAIYHYLFGYIHPFYDGNGRTSRIISSQYISREYHPLIGLRLSKVIKDNQKKYYDAFIITNSEYNRGDLTYFIIEFLTLLEATIKNAKELLVTRVKRLREAEKKLERFVEKNQITDQVIQDIYFVALQASMFSLFSGATKDEIVAVIGKSKRTLDSKLKEITSDHLVVTKVGKVLHFKLNVGILKFC